MIPLFLPAALACGGLFCSAPQQPINQAGERIVFAIDEEAGKVEMHTQITYEGPAETFAWLVPLPAEPELFVSTQELFRFLDRNTAPVFSLRTICTCCDAVDSDASAPESAGGQGPVVVVSSAAVGPYDTVTLRATSTDAMLDWLNTNQYYVPQNVAPFLDPYVSDGSYFVALKLQKDRDVGDLVPLGLSYPGTTPVIPLTMTAVAATPDMALIPWVLGSGRAVPENYLHVVINELAIDWGAGGANYNDVVGLAADLAGGQAFATDFAGSTAAFRDRIDWVGRFNVGRLRDATTVRELWGHVLNQGFVVDDDLVALLSGFFPDAAAVLADINTSEPGDTGGFERDVVCDEPDEPGCAPVDVKPAVDALATTIVDPIRRANALFDRFPYITRLTSSASPAEMTVDPRFVINPSLPDVAQVRAASIDTGDCTGADSRTLTLPDGTRVPVPSGVGVSDLLTGFRAMPVLRIEQTAAEGAPVVMSDNSARIVATLEGLGGTPGDAFAAPGPAGRCGCASQGGGAGWAAVGLVAALRRRRRAQPLS